MIKLLCKSSINWNVIFLPKGKSSKTSKFTLDLPRSRGKGDTEEDLLSILEEVKSGILTNTFRGDGSTLLMEPPHILVSGNYILNQELLSEDRWETYEIKKPSMKLKNITKSVKAKNKIVKPSRSLEE